MKKRIIALCMVSLVAFSLVACGTQKAATNDQGPRWDGYKDAPLPANAEPNWHDTDYNGDNSNSSKEKTNYDEMPSDDWEVCEDKGSRWDGYKDAPLPANAEPNWHDTDYNGDNSNSSKEKTNYDEMPSDDWEVCEDKGPRWDGYKDAPLPANAEPNWHDSDYTGDDSNSSKEKTNYDEMPSDDWVICIDDGPRWDGYKDAPLPPNAEPNWND